MTAISVLLSAAFKWIIPALSAIRIEAVASLCTRQCCYINIVIILMMDKMAAVILIIKMMITMISTVTLTTTPTLTLTTTLMTLTTDDNLRCSCWLTTAPCLSTTTFPCQRSLCVSPGWTAPLSRQTAVSWPSVTTSLWAHSRYVSSSFRCLLIAFSSLSLPASSSPLSCHRNPLTPLSNHSSVFLYRPHFLIHRH